MLVVGIDPGVHTGMAIWCKKTRQFIRVFTTDFWGCIEELNQLAQVYPKLMRVHIENPDFNAPVFEREHLKGNIKAQLRNAQDVGKNKAHGLLLIEYCNKYGIPVVPVRPSKHTRTKTAAPEFKRLTKYTGQTNQHGRDAGMLVWGF